MPEYLAPGVYIEELSTGPKPIEGVSTSTAAFLGRTEKGPIPPRMVTSWLDSNAGTAAISLSPSLICHTPFRVSLTTVGSVSSSGVSSVIMRQWRRRLSILV